MKKVRNSDPVKEGAVRLPSVAKFVRLSAMLILFLSLAAVRAEDAENPTLTVKRIGNIHPYAENGFQINAPESGTLTIRIHDNICTYRTLEQEIESGETLIQWDGCGYNRERLYEKSYTITAELKAVSGRLYSVSFLSPVEYAYQCLQYAMPSADVLYLDAQSEWFLEYRTVTRGTVKMEMVCEVQPDHSYSYSLPAVGGKITRREFDTFARNQQPVAGYYHVSVYETTRPEESYEFSLTIEEQKPEKTPVAVTGDILPDRGMSEQEIWALMMKPSVVVDIDYFSHQNVYETPDTASRSLGTIHGQTQGLNVLHIDGEWALIGAWNHEEAEYIEGWVPVARLKTETPRQEYGILIDKQQQTLSVFQNGKKIDTLLISSGRAEKGSLYQETSAGCFLTGYHRVNFSMNGKKYDYVIQYDGGNLLHQTPYAWGSQKKDFTLGRGYLGAKASHACIRIQPEPGPGGLNAYWLFTHIPYHTRVMILDDPEERAKTMSILKRTSSDDMDLSVLQIVETTSREERADSVKITFAGSFIPGGTRSFNNKRNSFVSFVNNNGYEAPFSDLQPLFENDDLTCLNLRGLLLGSSSAAPDGKAICYAPSDMAEVFRSASVELVQMTDDLFDTTAVASRDQIADELAAFTMTVGGEHVATATVKGHLFGFAGCSEKEYLANPEMIDRRIGELLAIRCERIIFLMSWGEDKASQHSVVQEAMAKRSIRAGANLVIGNHPGSVQGVDFMGDVPIVYSTGDLLVGNTSEKPKKQQGMLIQAEFDFGTEENGISLTVIPVLPYGNTSANQNDYQPTTEISRAESEDLIRSIWQDTADSVMEKLVCYLAPAS